MRSSRIPRTLARPTLASWFLVSTRSRVQNANLSFSPPAHATRALSGQFLGSLKASEAKKGLLSPMRGDASEQVVDPPSGSLGCTLGFPPPSQIKHDQNIHPRSPPVLALGRIRAASSPLASPPPQRVPRKPQSVHLPEGGWRASESIARPCSSSYLLVGEQQKHHQ